MLWATDAIFRLPLAHSMDPGTIVLLEHLVCVLATLPLFLVRRQELRDLKTKGWIAIAFVGLMGSAFGTYFFTSSYQLINPSVTILLQKLQPVFAVVAARVFLGEKPRHGFYLWGLVAIFGAALVSLPTGKPSFDGSTPELIAGIGFALAAAVSWGLCTVFGKFATNRVSFPVVSFLRFAWGLAGIAILLALSMMSARQPVVITTSMVQSILYMGLIPGVLAMYLYYAGLKTTRASAATFAEMFFPVTAVIVNWRILGQPLSLIQLLGMGLLLVAVFFISRKLR